MDRKVLTETSLFCRDMIEVLKVENSDLMKSCSVANSKQNEVKDKRATSQLDGMVGEQGWCST